MIQRLLMLFWLFMKLKNRFIMGNCLGRLKNNCSSDNREENQTTRAHNTAPDLLQSLYDRDLIQSDHDVRISGDSNASFHSIAISDT